MPRAKTNNKTANKKSSGGKSGAARDNGPNLVVVESPAKARTVGQFLGPDYKVVASMGHVRDLPERKMGVDVEHDFEPEYTLVSGRKSVIDEIKKAARRANTVYLATDPDREGEAISWHVVKAADLEELSDTDLQRVVFHEITRPAIDEAFGHPRGIDMKLVNAQQARRILDRIVGYRLSPVLWGKVRRGLSAGRVQSVALRMVVEREREIEAFRPEEYWNISTLLAKQESDAQTFKAALQGIEGQKGKPHVPNQEQADKIVADLRASSYRVASVKRREVKTKPAAPFTTSTLQQEAARRLRFGAQRTMRTAQQLYEGVQLGGGDPVGLITYMRTDSTNLSTAATSEAREYIQGQYGKDYVPKQARSYRTRSKNAQEAHEAIRPTSVLHTPEQVRPHLTNDQAALYDLIWKRMVACQMADSISDATTADIEATGNPSGVMYTVRATGSVIKFQGFRRVYVEARDDSSDDEEEDHSRELVPLTEGEAVNLQGVNADQRFTQPPPRYSEAMLIRTLEENGIGRPSTFASIVSTIEQREYVVRESNRFKPTKLGTAVNDFLVEWFPDIMDTGFTAEMEEHLDEIARGETEWTPMLWDFYRPFEERVEHTKSQAERVPSSALDEMTDEACEKCERPMVIKSGRYGKFLSCSGFPECRNTRPLRISTGVQCPKCGDGELMERQGRRGRTFYGCSNYPECDFSVPRKPLKTPCPECESLLIASGRNRCQCTNEECGYRGPLPQAEAPTNGAGSEEESAEALEA
ncbi:MAG: type I DNA topoisomerase [Chloroflexota bacterium]